MAKELTVDEMDKAVSKMSASLPAENGLNKRVKSAEELLKLMNDFGKGDAKEIEKNE